MAGEESAALVRRFVDAAINGGDLEAGEALLDDGFVNHNPDLDRAPSRQGYIETWADLRTAFPDFRFDVEEMMASGDRVVLRWTAHGTHDGPLMIGLDHRIAPTGRSMTLSGITLATVEGGRIAEIWTQQSDLGMVRQLGVVTTLPPDPLP